MAFNSANLVKLDLKTSGGLGTWKYNAGSDNLSTVEGGSYFTPDYILDVGEVVCVTANDGKAIYRSSGVSLTKIATVSAFISPYA